MDHSSDVVLNVFDKLTKRFMKYESNNDDSPVTIDYIIKLASALGYMAQVNGSIHKGFKQEKRIKALESKMNNDLSIPIRSLEEPQLQNYR